MKFIPLKNFPKNQFYNKLIRLGCGPNFVLNRQEAFEKMIKDQGVTFWFRFWLNFCLSSEFEYLQMVEKRCPELKYAANINIHLHFLKCPIEYSTNYCLESAIKKLKASEKTLHNVLKKNKQSFKDLLMEYCEMAFGVCLCVVFYEWLLAKDMDETSQCYWQIPKKYLDPTFQPTQLEKYLINVWTDELPQMLGVQPNQLYWFSSLIETSYDEVVESVHCPLFVHKMTLEILKNNDEWRSEIMEIDELRYVDPFKRRKLVFGNKKPWDNVMEVKCALTVDDKENYEEINPTFPCAYCHQLGSFNSNFKKCKRCVFDNWKDVRFYCSDTCQMEHWFQWHCKEHNQSKWQGQGLPFSTNNASPTAISTQNGLTVTEQTETFSEEVEA